MATTTTPSNPSTPIKTLPQMRGGFEVDEDGDNQDTSAEDAQEDDVYDAPASVDVNGSNGSDAGAVRFTLDRSSKSPTQENGMTPVPVQAVDTPANLPSSALSNHAQVQTSVASSEPITPGQSSTADVLSVPPKSRLAHDVVGILEDRIKDDPRGDTAAWLDLIEEYKGRNKDDLVRETYQRYLEVFPLAADQWCAWLRWEEASDRKFQMETIFKKALPTVPSVDLFSIYVNYVRRRNSMQTGDTASSYKNINSTFEFAIKMIGMDKDSGNMWQEYINFLKSGPGTVGGSGWQDSQKMDTLRDAYGKAVCVPTSALQVFWKEYEAFEMGINKINARKLMADRSPDYMTARSALTHLQNVTKSIDRTSRPHLPPALGFAGDHEYQQQVALWKEWILWEKNDHLVLKEDKFDAYLDRVIFTYKQALMALQFWPEMWYDAAIFCFANGKDDQGLSFLNQGFAANPESALLSFKLADYLESSTNNDDANDAGARSRMKKVREPYDKVLDALYTIDKKTEARMQVDLQRIEQTAQDQQAEQNDNEAGVNASNVAEKKALVDEQLERVKAGARAHLDLLSKIISHVWIALMRATRRIQGKGMPNEKGAGFRTIFNEARKKGKLTPDFYVESALIEWNCYRDATGTRILERGVKLFPEDNYLPLEYMKHLISKDDITNARAVFETTVNKFTSGNVAASVAKSKPLFLFFHDYESKFGELPQIVRLEQRMRELFPEDPALQQFSARYRTPGFDPMSVHPIVSVTQIQPKGILQSSVDISGVRGSPIQGTIDQIANISSPKRPLILDDDDEDGRPPKIARGESPFKAATQIRKVPQPAPQPRPPPPLPPAIAHLLSILPKASAYTDVRFDAAAIMQLIREKHLPAPTTVTSASRPPVTPQTSTIAGWPPQYGQAPPPMVPPPQGYAPPNGPPAPYGSTPYRYP